MTQSTQYSGFRSNGKARALHLSGAILGLIAAQLRIHDAIATPRDGAGSSADAETSEPVTQQGSSSSEPNAQRAAGLSAIELGRAALEAYTAGSWRDAHERFAEAERLVHSPVFLLYMARCQRNLGSLFAARDLFRKIIREALPPSAPPSWQQAVISAHAELATLQQNIPSVLIQQLPSDGSVSVKLDGNSPASLANGMELELEPGEHMFEVLRAGRPHTSVVVRLSEGRRRVPVMLSPRRAVDSPPPLRPATPKPERGFPTRAVVGYTTLGLGVLGLGLGAITGLVAKARTDDLKREECDASGSCFPRAQGKADVASQWATVSTASFIFGGTLVAAGGAVLLFSPNGTASQAHVVVRGAF